MAEASPLYQVRSVSKRYGGVVANEPSSAYTPDSLLKAITGLGQS